MSGHEICGEMLPCSLTVKTERSSVHTQCSDSTSKMPTRNQRVQTDRTEKEQKGKTSSLRKLQEPNSQLLLLHEIV